VKKSCQRTVPKVLSLILAAHIGVKIENPNIEIVRASLRLPTLRAGPRFRNNIEIPMFNI